MTDIDDIRAKLRDPRTSRSSGAPLTWMVLGVCGLAVGFALMWSLPRLSLPMPDAVAPLRAFLKASPTFEEVQEAVAVGLSPSPDVYLQPLQPSASLPTFRPVRSAHRRNVIARRRAPSSYTPYASDPEIQARPKPDTNYAGKSADEIAKNADEACFQRAHARYPHWSTTPRLTTKNLSDFGAYEMDHFDELLSCLITEGPARYCSASEQRMIAGEIAMYFRGIRYHNARTEKRRERLRTERNAKFNAVARRLGMRPLDPATIPDLAPSGNVIAAIEDQLRRGVLTTSTRERILAVAPEPIQERLMRIAPKPSPCPAQPWWAFWR